MGGLQEVTNALSNGTIPDPYGLDFPKIGGSQLHPKTAIAIISRTAKAIQTANLADTIRSQAH